MSWANVRIRSWRSYECRGRRGRPSPRRSWRTCASRRRWSLLSSSGKLCHASFCRTVRRWAFWTVEPVAFPGPNRNLRQSGFRTLFRISHPLSLGLFFGIFTERPRVPAVHQGLLVAHGGLVLLVAVGGTSVSGNVHLGRWTSRDLKHVGRHFWSQFHNGNAGQLLSYMGLFCFTCKWNKTVNRCWINQIFRFLLNSQAGERNRKLMTHVVWLDCNIEFDTFDKIADACCLKPVNYSGSLIRVQEFKSRLIQSNPTLQHFSGFLCFDSDLKQCARRKRKVGATQPSIAVDRRDSINLCETQWTIS